MNRISAALCAGLREPRHREHEALLGSLTADEWSAVTALAVQQRVAALFHSLNRAGVPEAADQILRDRARTAAMRGLYYQAELKHLADAVFPIQLIALKGIHLAASVYQNIGCREMSDIDVLVRQHDAEAVAAAARRLGYVPVHELDTAVAVRGLHHLPRLIKRPVALEIHVRLAPPSMPPFADSADLWRRAQPLAIAENTLALCPEDALLHVCSHATVSHHLELGIRSLCDLRAMIAAYGNSLQWDAVVSRATEWQCERGTALALTLARDLLGVDVPDAVLARFGTALPTPAVMNVARTHIFADNTIRFSVNTAAGKVLATRGRFGHLWKHVALEDDVLATLFPDIGRPRSWRRAVVLATRTARLIRQYGWAMVRLALKPASADRTAIDDRNTLMEWLGRPENQKPSRDA